VQDESTVQHETLFGHPVGLFTLFFAEMWERFSYYGMRALLVFYMLKGFLGYGDSDAYTVYGAYTALVYMTPFFGGMIADRLLGPRRAVVLGGAFMAAGHLMMTIENEIAFFTALAFLIAGNGFFKPNISTMVGSLYLKGSPRRDGGFTIFYMGVNLGAAMSPLLCGYIGETYGWHLGFGLATIGMLTGVAIFVAPSILSQIAMASATLFSVLVIFDIPGRLSPAFSLHDNQHYWIFGVLAYLIVAAVISLRCMGRTLRNESSYSRLFLALVIMATALAAAIGLMVYRPGNWPSIVINLFVAASLIISAMIAVIALTQGGLPAGAGAPPDEALLRREVVGISAEWLTYLGALFAVPVLALLVSGFSPFDQSQAITIIPESVIADIQERGRFGAIISVFLHETSKPAGLVLFLSGVIAVFYLMLHTLKLDRIPRQRMYVVLILTFFSMFFWSFFEQAGSSLNNFADRNVNRVVGKTRVIEDSDIGSSITIQPTQEQLGYSNGERIFTLDQLAALRDENHAAPSFAIEWRVSADNVGMTVADRSQEIPASWFQSVNAVFILVFGLIFTALWGYLGQHGIEPGTPYKFALGLLQLGLGFGAFWYGAQTADERGMVALMWLFIGYLLHTTGELCLSPVGLSMVTKLSPTYLVSTVMGTWFLATAFSQFLAAIIAQLTRVTQVAEDPTLIPAPSGTLHLYGNVFGNIAITAIASAGICFLLSPLLTKWMHSEVVEHETITISPAGPTQIG
jgi:POT family proton-dependent oligopeptide transporter